VFLVLFDREQPHQWSCKTAGIAAIYGCRVQRSTEAAEEHSLGSKRILVILLI
jgi:hypothetical protein